MPPGAVCGLLVASGLPGAAYGLPGAVGELPLPVVAGGLAELAAAVATADSRNKKKKLDFF